MSFSRSRESWRAISACSAALLFAAPRFLFRTTRKIIPTMTPRPIKPSRPVEMSPPPELAGWPSAGEMNQKLKMSFMVTLHGLHSVATVEQRAHSSLRSIVNVVAEKLPYIADKVSPKCIHAQGGGSAQK